jgi:hypothetical protein
MWVYQEKGESHGSLVHAAHIDYLSTKARSMT